MENVLTVEGIELLRFALLHQAAEDYTKACRWIFEREKNPEKEIRMEEMWKNQQIKKDCESFFRSRLYGHLYDVDGEEMIWLLQQSVRLNKRMPRRRT